MSHSICIPCFNRGGTRRYLIHRWSKKKCSICNGQNAGPDKQGLIVSYDDIERECDHVYGCDGIYIKYMCGRFPEICIHRRLEDVK